MGHWSTMCTICMDTILQWPAGKLLATSILTGAPSRLVGAPLDLFRFHLQHNEQPCAGAHARHLSAAVKASLLIILLSAVQINLSGEWGIWRSLDRGHTE